LGAITVTICVDGTHLRTLGGRRRDPEKRRWTRFVTVKQAPHILRPTPKQPATEARVTEFYRQYLAVAVFVLAAFLMVGAMLGIARVLRPQVPQDEKFITYESGSDPLPLFGQMNVRYYVYALLFVIFDVEAVFIFPWAVNVEPLGWFGIVEMTAFVLILLLGLAYVWRKGLLRWA
jgi:NADH-quinone oxidoreductase subunit A